MKMTPKMMMIPKKVFELKQPTQNLINESPEHKHP